MEGTAVARIVESSAMSDVDSMRAMRMGPRSERNPRVDEVDTMLLPVGATKRDNARARRSFPPVRHPGPSSLPPEPTTGHTGHAEQRAYAVRRAGRHTVPWRVTGPHGIRPRSCSGRSTMVRTLGVEEEMLLVDVHDGRPRSVSAQLLVRAARRNPEEAGAGVQGAVEGEFQQQQIETHTPPTADLDALRHEVRHWRTEAVAAARGTGSSVAALATSPLPVRPLAVTSPRYAWLGDRYQLTAREHLICGCHVHVSVEGDERSEEHTSELQSLAYLVCRLLLEKKKNTT